MALPRVVLPPAREGLLTSYYERLLRHFGPQGWWPARTRLEIILGAILTQNTAWRNATLAIARLRKAGLLRFKNLKNATAEELELCIRQAGFFRQKAAAILNFTKWLDGNYHGSLGQLFSAPAAESRQGMLGIKGLGPETVDAILLYAGRKPFFVADAYTRRILSRHGLLPTNATYETAQTLLHGHLPADQRLFNEFHALIVETGKLYCKRLSPECGECPLQEFLPELPFARGTDEVSVRQVVT